MQHKVERLASENARLYKELSNLTGSLEQLQTVTDGTAKSESNSAGTIEFTKDEWEEIQSRLTLMQDVSINGRS